MIPISRISYETLCFLYGEPIISFFYFPAPVGISLV